jgi:hypothetical protein
LQHLKIVVFLHPQSVIACSFKKHFNLLKCD